MLITVAITTVAWVTVTLVTRPEPDGVLESFYRRVRPGGPGWRAVSARLGFGREPIPGGWRSWANWLAGVVAVYASLFGIGKLIFGELLIGFVLVAIALAAFAFIARSFRQERPGPSPAAAAGPKPEALAAD
jgi:hypothetical protein